MNSTLRRARMHSWYPAPERPKLRRDEVHVWRASLAQPRAEVEAFRQLLSTDERSRADGFHFSRDYNNFIVARGILRIILGRYLLMSPEQLCFSYNGFGKPELNEATGGFRLRFNLAHAEDVALYAIADGHEVGVDIEYVREEIACGKIAEQFFSRREVAALCALPPEVQARAFFNCWTRKEAYIKARGDGLSLSLSQFDVSLAPGDPAALLETRIDAAEASRWSLYDLTTWLGFAAALAVEDHDWHLECWHWS